MHRYVGVVVAVLGPLACAPAQEVRAEDRGMVPPGIFRAPAHPPRAQYTIVCRVDLEKLLLSGTVNVSLTNTSSLTLHRLALDWKPTADRTILISSDGERIPLLHDAPAADNGPVVFDLPSPLVPDQTVKLDVQFTRRLSGSPNPDAMVLTDWHPRLWWGFATVDDFDVKIDVTSGYEIAASGVRDSESGFYRIRGACSFGLFLGRDLTAIEREVEGVKVRCLHSERGAECARLLLNTAADAVKFYRSWIGHYPHAGLTIVPGMDYPAGGFPIASGLVAVHGMERMSERPRIHWQWITAHEIGHMYWGEHVLERDSPGWLWIGLGIYADREYCRNRGLSLEKHRGLMQEYIDGVRDMLDTTVARSREQMDSIDFDFNNVVIHGKGFSIISALACVVGKEAFERGYKRCLDDFAGRRMGLAELRHVFEEETATDLGWFFDQWVRSNRYLSYDIADWECRKEGGGYLSTVRVQRLGSLEMPVPVVLEFEDGTEKRFVTERLLASSVLTARSESPLKNARIDPDSELALVVPPPDEGLAVLKRKVRQLPWTGGGDQALDVFRRAGDSPLTDGSLWAKLGLALYDGRHYDEALDSFRRAGETAAEDSAWTFAALAWQGHVLDLLDRRDEAVQFYKSALRRVGDSNMRHDQYGIKIDRRWLQARLEQPFQRED